jgi:hypothetical protein
MKKKTNFEWVLSWITKADQQYFERSFPTLRDAKAFGSGICDSTISYMQIQRRRESQEPPEAA